MIGVLICLLAQMGGIGGGPSLSKELKADEKRTTNSAVRDAAVADHSASPHSSSGSEVMVINPHDRAKDFKEVYEYLNTHRSSGKVTFHLKNGSTISHISDIILPNSGSLVIFKQSTTQGVRFKVVKVEDIESVVQQ